VEIVSKDIYWSIYQFCSVGDWARSRRLCQKLKGHAEHIDVLRKILVRGGGHPSEKFETAEEYKERIFEGLRFAHFLNTGNTALLAASNAPFKDFSPENARSDCSALSMQWAGTPDLFLTCSMTSSRLWNSRTGSLVREMEHYYGSFDRPFQIEGEPRLARLSVVDKRWRVEVYNLNNWERSCSKPLTEDKVKKSDYWARFGEASFIYLADAPGGPALLASMKGSLIIWLDAHTLEEKDRYSVIEGQTCHRLYVYNKQLFAHLNENIVALDLNTWVYGSRLLSNVPGNDRLQVVKVGPERDFLVYRRQGAVRVFGYDKWIPAEWVQEANGHAITGGHWGNHDYLLFWPRKPFKQTYFYIWRDDDTVKKVDGRELYARLPIRGLDGENQMHLSDRETYNAIALLPGGFALDFMSADVQPTVVRALPPETYGRTRPFLIAGLTAVALGILAYRWLRPIRAAFQGPPPAADC
jgi:hypothetical protein